ncbi:MAG: hypothetical protein LBW77_02035, partial [Verrucomicrobiota bacterium]|nr:hypothetical protein [Verrucomicrobiota bacterium]
MSEITPELLASIATRLYNEIPGAALVPKTETDAPLPDAQPPGLDYQPPGLDYPPPVPDYQSPITSPDPIAAFVSSVREGVGPHDANSRCRTGRDPAGLQRIFGALSSPQSPSPSSPPASLHHSRTPEASPSGARPL